MNCEEARGAYLAGDADRAQLGHLAACSECRLEAEYLASLRATLDDPAFWEEPDAEWEDQVVSLVTGLTPTTGRRRLRRGRLRWLVAATIGSVVVVAAATALVALPGSGPDWEVSLPATVAAPEAEATVKGWNEPTGTRVLLEVSGLADAPPGSVYEFWFSAGGDHVSAGTFRSAGDVKLWAGVSRAEFPRLWVTLEPLDEDPGPSRVTVLDTK